MAPTQMGRGILFALLTFASYSTADAAVKWLTDSYSIFQITFLTSVFALIPISYLVWRAGGLRSLRPRHPGTVLLRTVFLTIESLCAYYAFSRLPIANVYTLIFAAPLIVTALSAPLLREPVGRHRWAAVAVGFCGVLVVLRPGWVPLDIGYLGAAGSAVFFALSMLLTRRIGHRESASAMLVSLMLTKIVVSLAISVVIVPEVFQPMPLPHWGGMLFVGVFVGLAHIFLIEAFARAPAPVVAPFQYSQIVWAVFYGLVLFGDLPDLFIVTGSGIVIGSGLYILWRERMAKHRPEG